MAEPRKVLIITYYWPPGGGSGVQRWLKFTKYLRDFGWEPVIYTPENPEMPAVDESLARDVPPGLSVLRQPIVEPYSVYKWVTGRKQSERIGAGFVSDKKDVGALEKFARWIRGNLFIPDARRFWIRPSVRYLHRWLRENPVDVVVSTGPPHSMHLIALHLKRKLGLRWLADFRDPWTNIDFYEELRLSRWADRKHHRLEADVVKAADLVTVVSPTMAEEFEADHHRPIHVLTNGYDSDDVTHAQPKPADAKFSIAHIGTMNPARNPVTLWHVLSQLAAEGVMPDGQWCIRLIGQVDASVKAALDDAGIADSADLIPYMDHSEVVDWQAGASVLLLLLNQSRNARGILPGKFFEYMASGRPILCLGPTDSDAAAILRETGAGVCIDYDDAEAIKTWLTSQYRNHPVPSERGKSVEAYSRRELTRKLSDLLSLPLNQTDKLR